MNSVLQNVGAHNVALHQSKGPASSHLCNLRWLPNKHRINLKTLATRQPISLLAPYAHKIATSSVYTSIGSRTFSYAAPQIWNVI